MLRISTCLLRNTFSLGNRSPHQILGVRPYASVTQIKAAFYRLAKTHHPDVSESNSGSQFTNIRIAYQQMLEQSKSQSYQKKAQQKPTQQANSHKNNENKQKEQKTAHPRPKSKIHQHKFKDIDENQDLGNQDWEMEVQDLRQFEKAFNSYLNCGYLKKKYSHFQIYIDKILGHDTYYSETVRNQQAKNRKKQGKKSKFNPLDLIHHLNIDIDELGTQKIIKIQRKIICKKCEFYSQKNYVKIGCLNCKKTGIDENYQKCKECLGKGYHRKYNCKTCQNKKYIFKTFDEMVMIPLGANSGEKVIFKGRGHQHIKNGNFGDLIIVVNLGSKSGFSKQSHSLNISIADAVLGLHKKINTLGGLKNVYIPAGVQDGEVVQLDRIIYSPHQSQQYVTIAIKIPGKVSAQEKKIYEKLRKINEQRS